MEAGRTAEPLAVQGTLRMLVVVGDASNLDVARERNRIRTALEDLSGTGRLQVEWLEETTVPELQRRLRWGPHLLHFIGHGSLEPAGETGERQGVLWLPESEPLGAGRLAALLRDSTVRFVLLNACQSGDPGGMAEQLVRQAVPAALGMRSFIQDDNAIDFARGFYEALADGWPVDAALSKGRKTLAVADEDALARGEWSQPVLYMHTPDGRLFARPAGESTTP